MLWRFIRRYQAQGFIAGIEDFHAAHQDALEGIAADRPQSRLACGLLRQGREPVKVQVVACQRTTQYAHVP